MWIIAGIMAHNEETVITNCIHSLLSQNLYNEFLFEIHVVLNACTDGTEETIRKLNRNNKSTVITHLLKQKGKTNAINHFKDVIGNDGRKLFGLLFVDADITFGNNDVLYNIAKKMRNDKEILLIAPHNQAKFDSNNCNSITNAIYKAKTNFRNMAKGISFTGMCYLIRPDVALKITIPEYIIAEDRFISEKLRGGIYEDWSCNYYSPVPQKITTEVKRIFRHSVANEQINMLYRESGFTKGIINNPKIYGEGTWVGKKLMFKRWLKLDLIDKICIVFYFILSKVGDLRAILLFKKLGIKNRAYNINYWKVQR